MRNFRVHGYIMLAYGGNGHIYMSMAGQVTYLIEIFLSWPLQDVGDMSPSDKSGLWVVIPHILFFTT